MSPQKISAAGSVVNAFPSTFTPSKSRMAIEPVSVNQTSAKTWKVAGLANCAWHRTEDRRRTTEDRKQFRIYKTPRSQESESSSRWGMLE